MSVCPQRFAEQLECLSRNYQVVSLKSMVEDLRDGGKVADRVVAVTFDDGYADNFFNAKSCLEAYNVSATVFVSTGRIGGNREFWWDELERILLQPSTVPATLRLKVNGDLCEWDLGDATQYSAEDYTSYCSWNVTHNENPTARQRLYRILCQLLRPLREGEREGVLEQLRSWADVDPVGRHTHRCLTSDEVCRLGSGHTVEVGAHGVSHSALSGLSPAEQRSEIQQSKARLEGILGQPVRSFAYPYGTRSDYSDETAKLVREAGFSIGCANFPEMITRGADIYQLPRFIVRNWAGDRFIRSLDRWFLGDVGEDTDGT